MSPDLAVLGATFRHAPTQIRARLIAIDRGEDSPSKQLLERKFATGVVCIDTCSRSEWILSAADAKWAAELLKGAFLARLDSSDAGPRVFDLRTGVAAVHYLFRLAAGLDSLAEGEAAVGRQVIKAFERGHELGHTDRTLNLAWNHVGKMLHHKRRLMPSKSAVGVQKLVADELVERGIGAGKTAAILGMGQIGNSVLHSFGPLGFERVALHGRKTLPQFFTEAATLDVVIVSSGASQTWLDLPAREGAAPLCIDLGSPRQVRDAPGWQVIDLDALLARPGCLLTDPELEQILALVEAQSLAFIENLEIHTPPGSLGAMDTRRSEFMHQLLPKLLASIEQPSLAKDLRREIQAFTHEILQTARGKKAEDSNP
jgi:glutamyl-tRNA reductase